MREPGVFVRRMVAKQSFARLGEYAVKNFRFSAFLGP